MRKVSIIGLGWLGLPLAEHLQQLGWQVQGTKRNIQGCPIKYYPLDLNLLEITQPIRQVLQTEHLVIALPPSTCTPSQYQNGIQTLVQTAIKQGLKQLIFISSISVLPQQSGQFDEQTPATPSLLADLEQWLLAQPIHCDILRLAGLVGKQRHPVYYLAGKQNLSGANQPINLVHLEDCISAITLLLENPNGQRLYHLCSPLHPSRQVYYSQFAKQLGLADLHFSDEKQTLDRIVLADKICHELGFYYRYKNPFDFPITK